MIAWFSPGIRQRRFRLLPRLFLPRLLLARYVLRRLIRLL